jgi:hypothetical protein
MRYYSHCWKKMEHLETWGFGTQSAGRLLHGSSGSAFSFFAGDSAFAAGANENVLCSQSASKSQAFSVIGGP